MKNNHSRRDVVYRKFKWVDPESGHHYSGGGIVFFDRHGFWVIVEHDRGELYYTDIGGKYNYEDTTIYKTIARELGEETYHLCDATLEQIMLASRYSYKIDIYGHDKKPVYMCLLVHIDIARKANMTVCLDGTLLQERYATVIKQNPYVNPRYYKSRDIVYIRFDEFSLDDKRKFSSRLISILAQVERRIPYCPRAVHTSPKRTNCSAWDKPPRIIGE